MHLILLLLAALSIPGTQAQIRDDTPDIKSGYGINRVTPINTGEKGSKNAAQLDGTFENATLSLYGNLITAQPLKCGDAKLKDNTLGLIGSDGELILVACNYCRNGIYKFTKGSSTAEFYTFTSSDGKQGSQVAVTECLAKIKQIKSNIGDLNGTKFTLEKSDTPISFESSIEGTNYSIADQSTSSTANEFKSTWSGKVTGVYEQDAIDYSTVVAKQDFFTKPSFESASAKLDLYKKTYGSLTAPTKITGTVEGDIRAQLVLLGMYKKELEARLIKCSSANPCEGSLFEEAAAFNTWFNANKTFIKNLSYSVNLLTFNNADFYAYLDPSQNYTSSPLDKLDQLAFESKMANYSIANFQQTLVDIKKGEEDEKILKILNEDPTVRADEALDVFKACDYYRGKAYLSIDLATHPVVSKLQEWILENKTSGTVMPEVYTSKVQEYLKTATESAKGIYKFGSVFDLYETLGLIDPNEETKRLKSACMEFLTTAKTKLEASKTPLNTIKNNAAVVTEALNTRIDALNKYCTIVKETVDKIKKGTNLYYKKKGNKEIKELKAESDEYKESVNATVGMDQIGLQHDKNVANSSYDIIKWNDVMAETSYTKEIELYMEGKGKYSDTKLFPPIELAKVAYMVLFSDVYTENGTTIYSPMSILSADSTFRDKVVFKKLSGDFLLNCMSEGAFISHDEPVQEEVPQMMVLGAYSPSYSTKAVPTVLKTEDISDAVTTILGKVTKLLDRMDDEKSICTEGPDFVPGTDHTQYLSTDESVYVPSLKDAYYAKLKLEAQQDEYKKINEENKEYNKDRKELIGKYLTSSPTLIMNYILEGKDSFVNVSVLCDSLIAYYGNLQDVQSAHNVADWGSTALLLGSLFGGTTAIIMEAGAVIVSVGDIGLSVKQIFALNREKLIVDAEVITGGNALTADLIRQQKNAMVINEYINIGWDALVIAIVGRGFWKGAIKPIFAELKTVPSLTPELDLLKLIGTTEETQLLLAEVEANGVRMCRLAGAGEAGVNGSSTVLSDAELAVDNELTKTQFSKKPFKFRIEQGMKDAKEMRPAQIIKRAVTRATKMVKWVNNKLGGIFGKETVASTEKFLTKVLISRSNMILGLREMADCIKHASKVKNLVIKNLVNIEEIKGTKSTRLVYEFKVGDGIQVVKQDIAAKDLAELKNKFGPNVSEWLSTYKANTFGYDKWKNIIKNSTGYSSSAYSKMTEAELQAKYESLLYSQEQFYYKVSKTNKWNKKYVPMPYKLTAEQAKYVDNATLGFISDFFIRNASSYQAYVANLGQKDFSWWAIIPDLAGTSFKAMVPYVGIKKMNSVNSSMSFGYPDKTRFFTEQYKAAKASYLPTVEFNNTIETSTNLMYQGSDDAVKTYGLENENKVALARYIAATTWTLTAGIALKSFVWSVMQGATCMIPNWTSLVNLKMSKGVVKALQFSAALGLSYGYSYTTSDWFFGLRNFTLHQMDLYTDKELGVSELPLSTILGEDKLTKEDMYGLNMTEEDQLSASENVKAVITQDYDQEIPLEVTWAPVSAEEEQK